MIDAVVVGAGIGGLSSALALARAGQQVRVLEAAAELGEVGAGLQIAPNATRILRAWGLLDAVVAAGVTPRRLVLRDAVDGAELTRLDVADLTRHYGAPYVVAHRSDLHAILLAACRDAGVELVTSARVTAVHQGGEHATAEGPERRDRARVVVAADGLTSRLRAEVVDDEPVSSSYVAYRGAVPYAALADPAAFALDEMSVHIGPGCHFVQYALRGGEVVNQVAVFRSPRALAGEEEWGTPDELDDAFAGTCERVQRGLPDLWRDRWWRMYDREPTDRWVAGRLALTGDAAHPVLQYLAQGACQAMEDGAELGARVSASAAARGSVDWDAVLAGYAAARAPRAGRVQRISRSWGEFWHTDGLLREARNAYLRARDPRDYRYLDWLYAPAPDGVSGRQ